MKYRRILNDKANRLFFRRVELKLHIICLLKKQSLNFPFYWWKLVKYRLISRVQIKNYCILSGRPRGVFRQFKLSRILLRKVGCKGLLFGLKKKSW